MKKSLVIFLSVAALTVNGSAQSIFADEAVKPKEPEVKKEKPVEEKIVDITAEGKLLKNNTTYILKGANNQFFFLPEPAADSKIKLEDWLTKMVIITGKGTITQYMLDDVAHDKKTFTSITEIKLLEIPKKVESKPEEKK